MDVLIVEPLDPEVMAWLAARHAVQVAPELVHDAAAFRQALTWARAAVIPPGLAIDAPTIDGAPRLRIVARLGAGSELIDLDACARAGVEVVRPASASAPAEAEFAVGALLQMLRRVPIVNGEGLLVGREIGGSVVGIVGMTPSVKPLAQLLTAFGAKVLGYDPGVHPGEAIWARSGVAPATLRELLRQSDAVCVLLGDHPRYAGLFGERTLAECKQDQVLVSLSNSNLFNDVALARALRDGPLAAAWLDGVEPGLLDAGRALRDVQTLQVTPRVGSTTLQSRKRSAWAVAHRIAELLAGSPRTQISQLLPDANVVPAGGT